ncbi:MAG: hypothetical protein AB7G15_17020 [Alphaproteobacteria bacterium]
MMALDDLIAFATHARRLIDLSNLFTEADSTYCRDDKMVIDRTSGENFEISIYQILNRIIHSKRMSIVLARRRKFSTSGGAVGEEKITVFKSFLIRSDRLPLLQVSIDWLVRCFVDKLLATVHVESNPPLVN